MTITAREPVGEQDRTAVSLPALIALRESAGRARVAPVTSRSALNGQHVTRLFGRGMDYAESRVYQAGDDVRRLDWRLTARSGKLHTKLFQEDRESSTLLLLDTHPSMRFGSRGRFKSVQAARVAAALAWQTTQAGDRVAVVGFGAGLHQVLRPVAGMRGALAVCGALAQWDALSPSAAGEALSQVLHRARRQLDRASRGVLISDGFRCDDAAHGPLRELARRGSLGMALIADVMELTPALPGDYPMESAGQRGVVSLRSAARRDAMLRMLGAGAARLRRAATVAGCACLQVDGTADAGAAATRLLRPLRRSSP